MTFCEIVPLRPARRRTCTRPRIPTDRLNCRSPYNRADDLRGAGILDLLDLADDGLIDSCTNGARSKPRACDLAHDAANDGMDGDFSAASVVGEVMGEAEGFFTEDGSQLLPRFYFLLVEDFLQFVKAVYGVSS